MLSPFVIKRNVVYTGNVVDIYKCFDFEYRIWEDYDTSAKIEDYNITCSKLGYAPVTANDTAIIQSPDVPEFSMITLGLGLIAVLIGLFVIRKRK